MGGEGTRAVPSSSSQFYGARFSSALPNARPIRYLRAKMVENVGPDALLNDTWGLFEGMY